MSENVSVPNPSPILSVRTNAKERELIERAAEQARTSLSEFARQRLIEAAEMELLLNRQVMIPAADWERFEAWTSAPGKPSDALRKLAASTPAWET